MTCRILVPWLGIEPTPVHCKYLNHWPTREVLYLYFFVKPRNGLHWGVINLLISSVQSLSCVQLFATPWTAARQASLSITNSRSLLRLMSIESVRPFNEYYSVTKNWVTEASLQSSSIKCEWKSLSRVWLCNPTDCRLPGSSVHGDSPGKNTGVDSYFLLQGIFPTQGLNPGLHIDDHTYMTFLRR